MEADEIPNRCIQDPRFIKLLAASLCSDIAESKIILTEIDTEIAELKDNFSKECERRKFVKQSIRQLDKKKVLLSKAVESLDRDTKGRSIEIETAKNRLDDGALRRIQERLEFKRILENYDETWHEYKAEYEKRPLAIERQLSRINAQRLDVQRMIIEYKKMELMKMMKKRNEIDATRMKRLLVDISEMMLHRRKKVKYYEQLKSTKEEMEKELATCTRQLSEMQQREIERETFTEDGDTTFKMPPPRLQFPLAFLLQQHQTAMKNNLDHTSHDDLDTLSINTLMLEELCDEISSDSTMPKDNSVTEKSLHALDPNILRDESLDNIQTTSGSPSALSTPHHTAVNIFEESNVRDKLQGLTIFDKSNDEPKRKLSTMSKENFDERKERNVATDSHNEVASRYRNPANYDTSSFGKTIVPRGTIDEPKTNCNTIDEKSREGNNFSCNVIEDPGELPPILGQEKNASSSIINGSMELANSLRDISGREIFKKNYRGEMKISNDDECSKPKIRKIVASNDRVSQSSIKMEQRVTEMETKRFTDITSPSLSMHKYGTSCTSSNDLSNMLREDNWQQKPQGDTVLGGLPKNRNFSFLSKLGIWSPPQAETRELSFSSSSTIDHFAKSNNDARVSQRLTSDNPAIDLEEFFKKTGKTSGTMF